MHIIIGLPIAIGLWIGLWHLYKHAVGWYPGGGFWRVVLFIVLLPVGFLLSALPWANAPDVPATGEPHLFALLCVAVFVLTFAWFGSGLPFYLRRHKQQTRDASFTAAGMAWREELVRRRIERL